MPCKVSVKMYKTFIFSKSCLPESISWNQSQHRFTQTIKLDCKMVIQVYPIFFLFRTVCCAIKRQR